MAWDINKAIYALNRNAAGSAKHLCARYVRMAIEAGGISTAGRPGSAYQYQWYLPKIGFNKITTLATSKAEQNKWSQTNAKPGDIAVMEHGQHGHICMWNGSRWVSDFFQNNMWVYSGSGTCYLYRYDGEINNSVVPPYTPPWQGGADNSYSGGGQSVYSAPSNNQINGESASAASIPGQENDKTRTRIYKATNPTLVLDEMSMPMTPLGGNDNSVDYTAQNQQEQGSATGTENPTGA